ncbi:hypothetical protein VN0229_13540 [Helicobacter pylori]|nr:hypothetical protein VN0229_13540 [Helicobacter pylori]
MMDTATKLLASYQIFLNNAKESATNQITENKTQSLKGLLALLLIIQTNKGSKTLHLNSHNLRNENR